MCTVWLITQTRTPFVRATFLELSLELSYHTFMNTKPHRSHVFISVCHRLNGGAAVTRKQNGGSLHPSRQQVRSDPREKWPRLGDYGKSRLNLSTTASPCLHGYGTDSRGQVTPHLSTLQGFLSSSRGSHNPSDVITGVASLAVNTGTRPEYQGP